MDERTLKNSSPADYMNTEQLAFFAARLRKLKADTLAHIELARKTLASPPELNDDGDRAQYEEDARIALRIVERERKLLPKIDQALKRIARREYGYCEESGEPIGIARLLIRPTADLCADIKAINEEREKRYAHR